MSKQFSLNKQDFFKGLIMAVLISAVTVIQQSLESGTLVFNWTAILIASLSGALAYLVKNFFTTDSTSSKLDEYTLEQEEAINKCQNILADVGLEIVGTRPKDR